VARIKVVSVDYRQAPEAKFPAASEDAVAVYRELLKTEGAPADEFAKYFAYFEGAKPR
jgi:acetyl esterase/lipase